MPSLSHLLAIDARLVAAIRRAEAHAARPRPRRPGQPRRHRVEGQIVAQIALPRFLVLHSYLMSRKPKHESMMRAAHRMRGIAMLRYAQWASAHGKPLPTAHEPPAWAMHSEQRRHTRADQPSNQKDTAEKWLNPDEYPAEDFPGDAADWWDVFGDENGLPPDDWLQMQQDATPEQRKQWQQEAMASVSADLDFQDWIQNTVLNDLQVLQLLESYWNGQATLMSGQEMLGDMGIAGDFNLTDPMAMDFLRYQAGIQVTRIDENTRQQLANALWSGWGGEADEGVGPFGIPQLARYVQGVMQAWENGLSDMSYSRALLIANTEVARAETFGQYIAMLGSGVQRKIWVVTAGACQICVTQAEEGDIAIRDPFPNGLMSPPGHPRCRCSLSPFVDTSKPWNPKDWQYAPDPDQMRRLFQDPSFAQWPKQVANLNDPALQMVPPQQGLPANYGMIQWSDLPPSLQGVIGQREFDAGTRLDALSSQLGQAVFAVAQENAALQAQAGPLSETENTNAVLDDLLATTTDAQLTGRNQQLLQNILDVLGDLTGGGNGEGE